MQNSFGNAPRILVCLVSDGTGCEVVARGQSACIRSEWRASPAWHISLCNAIASAEGVDIIPKLKHPLGIANNSADRGSKDGSRTGESGREKNNCCFKSCLKAVAYIEKKSLYALICFSTL